MRSSWFSLIFIIIYYIAYYELLSVFTILESVRKNKAYKTVYFLKTEIGNDSSPLGEALTYLFSSIMKKIPFQLFSNSIKQGNYGFVNLLLRMNNTFVLVYKHYFSGNPRDFQVHEGSNVSESISCFNRLNLLPGTVEDFKYS